MIKSNFFPLRFLHVAFEGELFKLWAETWEDLRWVLQAGVGVGEVIAAMIAATSVRRDNKSNYKDGSPSSDPVAVWN